MTRIKGVGVIGDSLPARAPGKGETLTPSPSAPAPNAVGALYQATTELNKARGELIKLKALFEPGTAAYAQCEKIDDHLFEVSLKLGE